MSTLLLTARDPLTSGDGAYPVRTATALAADGVEVTLVLLEDAVTLARPGHRDAADLAAALDAGVEVLVEDEAGSRRALAPVERVKPTTIGEVVDRLVTSRVAWL
jgi:predicted peroxiredoxin